MKRSVSIRVMIERMSTTSGMTTSATWMHTRQPEHCVVSILRGFNIENLTAKLALLEAKDEHTRCWQTKEGTCCLKGKLLSDVRDTDVEMADTSTGLQ